MVRTKSKIRPRFAERTSPKGHPICGASGSQIRDQKSVRSRSFTLVHSIFMGGEGAYPILFRSANLELRLGAPIRKQTTFHEVNVYKRASNSWRAWEAKSPIRNAFVHSLSTLF